MGEGGTKDGLLNLGRCKGEGVGGTREGLLILDDVRECSLLRDDCIEDNVNIILFAYTIKSASVWTDILGN